LAAQEDREVPADSAAAVGLPEAAERVALAEPLGRAEGAVVQMSRACR